MSEKEQVVVIPDMNRKRGGYGGGWVGVSEQLTLSKKRGVICVFAHAYITV